MQTLCIKINGRAYHAKSLEAQRMPNKLIVVPILASTLFTLVPFFFNHETIFVIIVKWSSKKISFLKSKVKLRIRLSSTILIGLLITSYVLKYSFSGLFLFKKLKKLDFIFKNF